MSALHTKGPWVPMGKPTVGFMEVKARPSPAFRGFTKTICHMDGIETDTKEREANARLIAAAPDMLEALQNLMRHMPDDPDTVWIDAQEAIARATGADT